MFFLNNDRSPEDNALLFWKIFWGSLFFIGLILNYWFGTEFLRAGPGVLASQNVGMRTLLAFGIQLLISLFEFGLLFGVVNKSDGINIVELIILTGMWIITLVDVASNFVGMVVARTSVTDLSRIFGENVIKAFQGENPIQIGMQVTLLITFFVLGVVIALLPEYAAMKFLEVGYPEFTQALRETVKTSGRSPSPRSGGRPGMGPR